MWADRQRPLCPPAFFPSVPAGVGPGQRKCCCVGSHSKAPSLQIEVLRGRRIRGFQIGTDWVLPDNHTTNDPEIRRP